MKYSRLLLLLIPVLVIGMYGCSGKPTEQIEKTEKAQAAAKAEYADQFAQDDWRAAEQAFGEAQGYIAKEKWGDATRVLLKAKTRYEKARDLAHNKKDAKIQEISGKQTTLEKRAKTLKDALDAGGAKITAAKKQLAEEVYKGVEEKLAKISTQLKNGQFQDADYLAGSTLREVWEATQEIEGGAKKK
jgi:hypothetical protein